MTIKLHNTLSNSLEEFKSIKPGLVTMYHCGPTVYDYVHIGNLRSFLLADLLRRAFEFFGLKVLQVMNITDVGIGGNNDEGEDKIIQGLKREGKNITMESMKELGDFYTERFCEDIAKLNIMMPNELPRASEHIKEQIELIQILETKGFTYTTSDGIYFDTTKDSNYGRLGGLSDQGESRLDTNKEKRSSRDFALWKLNSNLGFPSPWGQGFPGWHLECSAMSTKYLGKTFDVHTGGIDLSSIHHNNEIAQSENASGCQLAHYWLHNEFVNVKDGKMAKSEGNQINLKDLVDQGFTPLAYRYFLLLSHYRTPTHFTWEALKAAENAYRKLKEIYHSLSREKGKIDDKYKKEFERTLQNDLNTPEAVAVVWKLVKDTKLSSADKRLTLLDFDKVLGLNLEHNEYEIKEIPNEISDLLQERELARKEKNWKKADEIRQKSIAKGYDISDTSEGQKVRKI